MRRRRNRDSELHAREQRRLARGERSWQEGPTPDRAKERSTETPKPALDRIKANKVRDDRRRMKRMTDAAATALGRQWHPSKGRP